ncbi:MAG: ABC transporter permease subunit, partial [Alphaproteobacteria bacterium]
MISFLKNERNVPRVFWLVIAFAALLTVLRPWLPDGLVRVPEALLLPWRDWIDTLFQWFAFDLGFIHVTRWITGYLEFVLNAVSNVLYGKSRWPRIEEMPWTAITAVVTITGFYLGGWRLALLAFLTFVWTALVGQWKLAMETMSVILVAAPLGFVLGGLLGIWSWKSKRVEEILKPMLLVMQVLPFFSYLLPAVIFFKVGPTAATVATVAYSLPPMILMTTIGLKKVSPEVVEAGKMSGCTKWQMLWRIYIPSARSEILVGLNQVIMLCLAMVVLTAAIGMPGLGAKLLSNMGSFKLGRSLEIGVTIVLLAVTLDRLSKAWVVKQPTHFEKGTPWWKRNFYLILALGSVVLFYVLSSLVSGIKPVVLSFGADFNLHTYLAGIMDGVHRKESLSQGKDFDKIIKAFLGFSWVTETTDAIRYFVNVYILVPTEKALLFVPTPAVILVVSGIAYRLGGFVPGVLGFIFFCIVAQLGYWDRAMLTMHTVFTATFIAFLIGVPLAIYSARKAARSDRMILMCDTLQTFPSYVYLLPAIMLFGVSPVTVILSVLIYTTVPVIRYTIEGLRGVPSEMTEAAEMSGATRW